MIRVPKAVREFAGSWREYSRVGPVENAVIIVECAANKIAIDWENRTVYVSGGNCSVIGADRSELPESADAIQQKPQGTAPADSVLRLPKGL